jgi:hypothetical protein
MKNEVSNRQTTSKTPIQCGFFYFHGITLASSDNLIRSLFGQHVRKKSYDTTEDWISRASKAENGRVLAYQCVAIRIEQIQEELLGHTW